MVGAEAGHRPVSEAVQRPCTQFDLSDCISGPRISPWLPGSLAHSRLISATVSPGPESLSGFLDHSLTHSFDISLARTIICV